jgi:uncharacterized protein (UPF0333 family)
MRNKKKPRMRKADLERSGMTTKIMQRLAGKVSVLIMVALLIAAVGTYGLSNSKHDSTERATAAVTSKAPVATATAAVSKPAVSVVKDVSVCRTQSFPTRAS